MILKVKTNCSPYNIYIERGMLKCAKKVLNLDRKVLIVTDSGVPGEYSKEIQKQCKNAIIATVKSGEESKNIENFQTLLKTLTENSFTRSDCVVAVGGGVVGDLAGFVAASYMRGIDFYNIPTTLLSQVDSSIGGKVAIDFSGYKNIVGAFYPPKAVIIDSDLLKTLESRQITCGMVEALKMSVNFDKKLFDIFETRENLLDYIDEIIVRSLKIKRSVVQKDEKEIGLRKVLNFGHTIGHAVESIEEGRLLHGECVAIGMLPLVSPDVRKRLIPILNKIGAPINYNFDADKIGEALFHDKKKLGDKISVILCDKIGTYKIIKLDVNEIKNTIKEY